MSKDIRKIIEEAVLGITQDDLVKKDYGDLPSHRCTARQLKEKQIQNATAKYASGCRKNEIVILCDTSIMDNGKTGILFSTEGLYYNGLNLLRKKNPIPVPIKYSELQSIARDGSRIWLNYKNGQKEQVQGSIYAGFIVLAMQKILSEIRAEKQLQAFMESISKPIAEEKPEPTPVPAAEDKTEPTPVPVAEDKTASTPVPVTEDKTAYSEHTITPPAYVLTEVDEPDHLEKGKMQMRYVAMTPVGTTFEDTSGTRLYHVKNSFVPLGLSKGDLVLTDYVMNKKYGDILWAKIEPLTEGTPANPNNADSSLKQITRSALMMYMMYEDEYYFFADVETGDSIEIKSSLISHGLDNGDVVQVTYTMDVETGEIIHADVVLLEE